MPGKSVRATEGPGALPGLDYETSLLSFYHAAWNADAV